MTEAPAEIFWLTLTILMTAVFWMPYVLNRIAEDGLWPALQNPEPDGLPERKWAQRMEAAHANAVENLVLFAPLALTVAVFDLSNALTLLAVKIYFFARLAHFIVYAAGVPVMRTLMFAAGFAAQLILAFVILGVL